VINISVIINTYNRALSLRNTLDSFRWQNYPHFEIVVVNGPSTDNTIHVLEEYAGAVKVVSCPVANISVSRNIGISHAAGDVVAFIDDDAIPYPNWLHGLSAEYVDHDVGGVGGFVWDHTGMTYYSHYVSCDRFGEARFFDHFDPSGLFSFPHANWYPSLMGVNSSFRKSALLEIGGFNEVYAYFLDETDVCLRIIDRGYKIAFSRQAKVYHKYLSSHIRDAKGKAKTIYPVVKSKINFIRTHGRAAHGNDCAEKRIQQWILERKTDITLDYVFRSCSKEDRRIVLREISDAYSDVLENGGFKNDNLNPALGASLKPFPVLPRKLRVVIITADFPPMANGGIGTLMKNVSTGLARLGHEVHVISRSEVEAVDFEDGTFVHRIKARIYQQPCIINNRIIELPSSIKNWAGTAKERAEFISSEFGRVDIVISPIWDVEGCYALASSEWKSVITLHTTYAMSVDTHPEWSADSSYYEKFVKKVIAAEKALLESSHLLLANSIGLVAEMESVYGVKKDNLHLLTVPHGVKDLLQPRRITENHGTIRGLFVGRLELRKGVDVLFEVLPEIFDSLPQLSFDIVGDDSIPVYGARTVVEKYQKSLMPYIKQGRLRILGKVTDDDLAGCYNACDFFVAPSRFESFGLILAEAMSCGKPVIACRIGGMVEVVGDAGLLAEPGDAVTLKEHMLSLVRNKELRQALGRQARSRFERLFNIDRMVQAISTILEGVVK
jgi:glycogen(starch) synthase